jgi:hypothetical protein
MFKIGLIILALIGLVGTTTHYAFANNMGGPAMGPADSGGGGGGGSIGSSDTTTSPGGNEGWEQHTWNNPGHEHLFWNDPGYHWWNNFHDKPHWFWNLPYHHWWNHKYQEHLYKPGTDQW